VVQLAELGRPGPVLPEAGRGERIFRYKDNSGVTQTLNILALAGSKGQTSTVDPSLAKLFATSAKRQGPKAESTAPPN